MLKDLYSDKLQSYLEKIAYVILLWNEVYSNFETNITRYIFEYYNEP